MNKKRSLGTLHMAANNIGIEKDTPVRALEALKESALLIFEEAKGARKALKQAHIKKNFALFNEHNQQDILELAKEHLQQGSDVCYMSDQGSPTLCDPGQGLTEMAFQIKAPIKVIPGPSSVTAAMSACPFPINDFFFTGLLPRKPEEKEKKIKHYLKLKTCLIILDTPYRRKQTLETFANLMGAKTKAFLALDISGENESYFLGTFKSLMEQTKDLGKLNFILIIKNN